MHTAPTLSRGARAYIWTVATLGVPLGAYCAYTLVRDGVPSQFLIFAILTLASGRFTLKVPSVEAHFSPSEMFAFANVLLFVLAGIIGTLSSQKAMQRSGARLAAA